MYPCKNCKSLKNDNCKNTLKILKGIKNKTEYTGCPI